MSREDIMKSLKLTSGGKLTEAFNDLISCDFIRKYNAFGNKNNGAMFQLTDLYTLFYMSFCHSGTTDTAYWTHQMGKPRQNTWYGLAFPPSS